MPKGTPAEDDMDLRLKWPHPPSPVAESNGDHRNGPSERGQVDLELVLNRLDVIAHQLKMLTDAVESLRATGAGTSPSRSDASTATARAPRRTTTRRKPAT